jgi:hypothetical protein
LGTQAVLRGGFADDVSSTICSRRRLSPRFHRSSTTFGRIASAGANHGVPLTDWFDPLYDLRRQAYDGIALKGRKSSQMGAVGRIPFNDGSGLRSLILRT